MYWIENEIASDADVSQEIDRQQIASFGRVMGTEDVKKVYDPKKDDPSRWHLPPEER
jgi:phage FluMu protein gp41